MYQAWRASSSPSRSRAQCSMRVLESVILVRVRRVIGRRGGRAPRRRQALRHPRRRMPRGGALAAHLRNASSRRCRAASAARPARAASSVSLAQPQRCRDDVVGAARVRGRELVEQERGGAPGPEEEADPELIAKPMATSSTRTSQRSSRPAG